MRPPDRRGMARQAPHEFQDQLGRTGWHLRTGKGKRRGWRQAARRRRRRLLHLLRPPVRAISADRRAGKKGPALLAYCIRRKRPADLEVAVSIAIDRKRRRRRWPRRAQLS